MDFLPCYLLFSAQVCQGHHTLNWKPQLEAQCTKSLPLWAGTFQQRAVDAPSLQVLKVGLDGPRAAWCGGGSQAMAGLGTGWAVRSSRTKPLHDSMIDYHEEQHPSLGAKPWNSHHSLQSLKQLNPFISYTCMHKSYKSLKGHCIKWEPSSQFSAYGTHWLLYAQLWSGNDRQESSFIQLIMHLQTTNTAVKHILKLLLIFRINITFFFSFHYYNYRESFTSIHLREVLGG